MKYAALLIAVFSIEAYAAGSCQIEGQYVLVSEGGKQYMMVCRNGALGLSTSGYPASDLLPALEAHKNDPQFIGYMKQLELGNDYESIKNTLKTTPGQVKLLGENSDVGALTYISTKTNDSSGVNETLAARAKLAADRDADRKKREATPVNMTEEELKNAANANFRAQKTLNDKNCASSDEKDSIDDMRIYKVTFADGVEGIFMPFEAKKSGDGTYKVQLQEYGKALGSLQVSNKTSIRTLKFKGGQVLWVGADGKEYPVAKFTKMTAKEALGVARPFGWGNRPDSCLWAKNLADQPASAGGASPASSATVLQNSGANK